jgi:DNA-binding MarR family transcriptional regulator
MEAVMREQLSRDQYRALSDFRFLVRRFQHFSDQAARGAGLQPQQHQMLLAIKATDDETCTIGYVAERLLIQHHTAVELVARTEARGLVSRHRGENDRRQVFLRLTPAGERALVDLSSTHHRELQNAAPELIRSLRRLLDTESEEV